MHPPTRSDLVDDDVSLCDVPRPWPTAQSQGPQKSKAKSDPLTASLIASFEMVDINTVCDDEDIFDASLIASASFADADAIGKASGEASGITSASSDMTLEFETITETDVLGSDTTASGTVATDVSVENGVGVGVSAIGSVNDVDFDAVTPTAEVDDTSFMVTYAAGEGKKVKNSATTTDAATSSVGEFDAFDTDTLEEFVDLDSNTVVSGSGSSAVQVAGGHQGESLELHGRRPG